MLLHPSERQCHSEARLSWGSLDNKQLVLCDNLPPERMCSAKDPREYGESLNPSGDVINLPAPLLRRCEQEFATQISVGFWLLSLEIFCELVSQINKLASCCIRHQLLQDR